MVSTINLTDEKFQRIKDDCETKFNDYSKSPATSWNVHLLHSQNTPFNRKKKITRTDTLIPGTLM